MKPDWLYVLSAHQIRSISNGHCRFPALYSHIIMFITDSGLYFIFGFLCVAGLTVQVRNLSGHAIFHLDLFESGASASQAEWAWHPPLYICNYGEVLEAIWFPWCFFPFNLIYHSWYISVGHLLHLCKDTCMWWPIIVFSVL